MSTPRLIKVKSVPKMQERKELCKSIDCPQQQQSCTIVRRPKECQSESCEEVLAQQIKKLSKDNDRMWKLLTQSQQQSDHTECSKIQKKLRSNLEVVEKEASMMREMYSVERANHQQSKLFFERREQEWQEIVVELKKVIEDYESTSTLNMARASQLFSQTTEMKRNSVIAGPTQQSGVGHQYGLEHVHPPYKQKIRFDKRSTAEAEEQEVDRLSLRSKQMSVSESDINESQIRYNEGSQSGLSTNSKRKHRSNLFRNKNLSNSNSKNSASKLYNKLYAHQQAEQNINQKGTLKNQHYTQQLFNQTDVFTELTLEEIFEKSLRRTYVQYRAEGLKANNILQNPHMEKLKNAKTSSKQRLAKTIKKVLFYETEQELGDILKFIEQKMYKKYRILKGENAYAYIKERLIECEQIFQSSNSALELFDSEPTNFINGVRINSKFEQFQNRQKQFRSQDVRSMNSTQKTPIQGLIDMTPSNKKSEAGSSQSGSNLLLNLDSNIKDRNSMTQRIFPNPFRQNHHLGQSRNSASQKLSDSELPRQLSKKNIYTAQRNSRRKILQSQLSKNKSRMRSSLKSEPSNSINQQTHSQNNLHEQSATNLSSLIGSHELELTPIRYSVSNESLSKPGLYLRTTDNSLR